MADAFTSYWGLTKPEVGASRDTWGTKLNADLDALDALLLALQPIGAMTDFAGFFAPYGWLMCDGTVYQIATYPRLFGVISNAYGGDGVTTFAVPDTRGRMLAGAGTSTGDLGYTLTIGVGQKVGDAEIALGTANLPSALISTTPAPPHAHLGSYSDVAGDHAHGGQTDFGGLHNHQVTAVPAWHNGGGDAAGGPDTGINPFEYTSTDGNHVHTFTTGIAGRHQHALYLSNDGVHVHTFQLGDGTNTPVRIVPPMFGTTKIICCGPPTMQTITALTAPALLTSPMRGLN